MDDLGLRAVAARSGERIELGDSMLVEIEDVSLTRRAVYGRRVIDAEGRRTVRRRRSAEPRASKAGRAKSGTTGKSRRRRGQSKPQRRSRPGKRRK
jgi:ribonuclease R